MAEKKVNRYDDNIDKIIIFFKIRHERRGAVVQNVCEGTRRDDGLGENGKA